MKQLRNALWQGSESNKTIEETQKGRKKKEKQATPAFSPPYLLSSHECGYKPLSK